MSIPPLVFVPPNTAPTRFSEHSPCTWIAVASVLLGKLAFPSTTFAPCICKTLRKRTAVWGDEVPPPSPIATPAFDPNCVDPAHPPSTNNGPLNTLLELTKYFSVDNAALFPVARNEFAPNDETPPVTVSGPRILGPIAGVGRSATFTDVENDVALVALTPNVAALTNDVEYVPLLTERNPTDQPETETN